MEVTLSVIKADIGGYVGHFGLRVRIIRRFNSESIRQLGNVGMRCSDKAPLLAWDSRLMVTLGAAA